MPSAEKEGYLFKKDDVVFVRADHLPRDVVQALPPEQKPSGEGVCGPFTVAEVHLGGAICLKGLSHTILTPGYLRTAVVKQKDA